jgi:hypothetical protein
MSGNFYGIPEKKEGKSDRVILSGFQWLLLSLFFASHDGFLSKSVKGDFLLLTTGAFILQRHGVRSCFLH